MEWLTDPHVWIALLTLTALEIVLGIDNIVFISIIASKLPPEKEKKAMRLGLGLAMFIRVGLLFSLSWIIGLTAPLFTVLGQEISGRDLLLLCGGLFLIAKSTHEMHEKLEGEEGHSSKTVRPGFLNVIVQILLLDIVFSLDSVITAVGMVDELWIMITAVVVAIGIMMLAAPAVSGFVHRHPTIKVLALSFLILIGVALVAESLDRHIPKGYIYFAMAYAVGVELINMRVRRSAPVHLHEAFVEGDANHQSTITGTAPE
jgi:predicted tellurium resistance membrane protein TerC